MSSCLSTARSAQVDGWKINIPTQDAAIEVVTRAARNREGFTVFTLNLDHLVKLRRLPSFQRAYEAARFVTADGFPVVRLGRRTWPELSQTTGADLFLPLCKAAADQGLPIYLFGSSDDVLEKTVQQLRRATRGRIAIAGYAAPALNFDVEGNGADASIEEIMKSEAALCFVMLGAPKQEVFATRAVERGAKIGFVCVGAAADFIAGKQSRAPSAMRRFGLEWLWRLAHSPLRLGARYARCAILLAQLELGLAEGGFPARLGRR